VTEYKPLLSSAPAHSILNARTFRYTSSVATDIRRTFARIRREQKAEHAAMPRVASNVRPLTKAACDASSSARSPASLRSAR
jgi:hypothetical protein